MERPRFSVGSNASPVVQSVGNIRRLLDLQRDNTGSHGVNPACRDKNDIASADAVMLQEWLEATGLRRLEKLRTCGARPQAGYHLGASASFDDEPHLGFSGRPVFVLSGELVVGVYLNTQHLFGVEEFHQQRKPAIAVDRRVSFLAEHV
ncbi:MAG: hypothetical protein BWY06_03445 [Candidatus Latescibacteria bacterium ADurb.Bin168]|nr:MAG: hypothetical protein BWY06_03445 [Candidatus Latescibacteria bacterium ADurb.Bin168]